MKYQGKITDPKDLVTKEYVDAGLSGKLSTSGDGSNVTAAFTSASSRANISTGEKLSVIFGKIAKWFADLGAAAFRSVDSVPTASSTNLVESGGVKSALDNKADQTDLASIHATGRTNATGALIPKYTYFYLNSVLSRAKADIAENAAFTSDTNYETVTAGGLNALRKYDYDTLLDNATTIGSDITVPNMSRYGLLIFGLRGTTDPNSWMMPLVIPYSLFKTFNSQNKRIIVPNNINTYADLWYVSDTKIRIYDVSENRSLSIYGIK